MSGHRWTPDEMRSLTGTTAVVTGANSGIGWYTALELARHAASVTLAVRTPAKGEAAAARIRKQVPGADVRVRELDLGSLDSVRAFAEDWQGPLGLLVNNAGLMTPPRYQQTRDGFELQFGTNHLGHFALTGRLLRSAPTGPADIPSLAGTTAVVTGANSGIGWHTAAELARHGADVTLAVRNLDKGEAAAGEDARGRHRRRTRGPAGPRLAGLGAGVRRGLGRPAGAAGEQRGADGAAALPGRPRTGSSCSSAPTTSATSR